MVKNLPAVWETWVWPLDQEDPLEKDLAIHSSVLARRIPWIEELGGPQSMGSQRVGHNSTTIIQNDNIEDYILLIKIYFQKTLLLLSLSHVWLFCNPMDCSPLDSYVCRISQARILEWVTISSFKGCSLPRDQIWFSCISCIGRRVLYY